MEFADEGGEGRRPTRCCCTPRWSATARASRDRTASRSSGASCSRCSTRRRPCTLQARLWGPEEADELLAGPAAGTPVARVMTASRQDHAGTPQSAAAPSPFPPIAEYAFLSNCHTGALIAPDGAVDWLCVPSFDSPSVFGSLLDRQAGSFRLGPFGINHPTARVYEPGTNVLVTTWKTPTGWIVVRDALTMGPTTPDRHGHPAHAPARRRRRRAPARAHGRVPRGQRRGRARLRAGLRLRASAGRVDARRRRPHTRRRDGRRADDPARHRHGARHRGRPRSRPARRSRRASRSSARSRGPRGSRAPTTSTTRRRGSTRPCASGAAGSAARASPTTAGATRSSAPRSRSRA